MQEKILSSVDPARFMQTSQWNFKQQWQGQIDISIWLRAAMQRGGRLYVLLEYTDQDSPHVIPIDRCMTPSSEALLLNGRVTLSGRGAIRNIQLKLKFEACDPHGFVLEELSLKPVQDKASAATKTAQGANRMHWGIAV